MEEWDARENCLPLHEVIHDHPELRTHVRPHPRKKGRFIIDLGDPAALLAYNKALLTSLEGLYFDIPPGALIPSICFRRTLLKVVFSQILEKSPKRMLEIGIGRSAVIAMIAARRWDVETWGTDHEEALKWARINIVKNHLENRIHLVTTPRDALLKGLPLNIEQMDLILTNPPYYGSNDEQFITQRGFQGRRQELIAGDSPVSFANTLLREWLSLGKPSPLVMVLPKLEWISALIVKPTQVHQIKAGTRKRYLVYHDKK